MQNPYEMYQKNQKAQSKPKKKPKVKKKMKKRAPQKNKGSKIPVYQVLASAIGLLMSFYIFAYTDDVIDFISRIDVSTSTAKAADEEKKSTNQKKKEAKPSTLPVGEVSRLETDANNLTMKNASVFDALKKKRRELEKKERDLARLEEDLQKQKVEIEKQLKELTTMRREISSVLEKKVKADKESVDKLVGVYSNMKPANAAKIIDQINEELAIKVLSKMKKQNAAAILNFIEPKKAQMLSEKFAGLDKK
ncbi:MAG: hypothetical protein HRT44_02680 [Bdellovibrionales bacterium]|nr:hypothetical protein [Bdellovibrionales bacterium]NQZ18152.1 hypothetical protein [Bdellovibrionales bacterium]